MKVVFTIGLFLFCAAMTGLAEVKLELINPATGTSSFSLTPGSSFSLDIDVVDASGSVELDSFDIQLSSSTTAAEPLAADISLSGFTDTLSDWETGSNVSELEYSAAASSTSDDVDITSSPATIAVATFTTSNALMAGDYSIDFAPSGSFQNLYLSSGAKISYTTTDAGIEAQSVPEPGSPWLMMMGICLLAAAGRRTSAQVA